MRWYQRLFRRELTEKHLDAELRFHLEQRIADLVAGDMAPEEARRQARLEFGGLDEVKEECRDVGSSHVLESFMQDIRCGLRQLRRSPAFTAIAVLTLALAIGANTAVFSLLDAWMIRPLPFKNPARLVIVLGSELKRPTEPAIAVLYRDFVAWKEHNRSFADISGMFWHSYLVTGSGRPEEVSGMLVTDGLFSSLGVTPELGRTFIHDDLGGPPVVVLSHSFWATHSGSSPAGLGTYITLNSVPHRIIGVMPASFDLRMLEQPIGNQGIWTLLQPSDPAYGPSSAAPIAALGHLKPGVTAAAAQADLRLIQDAVESKLPDGLRGFVPLVTNLQADNTIAIRSTLFVLATAVALVLVIACTNIGALLIGRGVVRTREFSVRAALGSGRSRLLRQVLIENLLLCTLGSGLGILLAWVGLRSFIATNPLGTLPVNAIMLNGQVLAFTAGITILATLLFGLVPALRASRTDLNETLKSSAGRAATSRSRRTQSIFLTAQIGLTVIVLVAACLLTETLRRIASQPLGILSERVAVMTVDLPQQEFPTEADQHRFCDQLVQGIKSLPGIETAAASTTDPIYGASSGGDLTVEGQPPAERSTALQLDRVAVTSDFFHALSVPILAGRSFTGGDNQNSVPVAIVSQHVVRTAFGGGNPLGKRVRIGDEKVWREVVGVVGDVRSKRGGADRDNLDWAATSRAYVPYWQERDGGFGPVNRHLYFYVHTPRLPSTAELRGVIATLSPNVPIVQYDSLTHLITDVQRQPRLRTISLSGFALLAVVLAAMGVYGVVFQSVVERTREIGIRIALGAQSGQLLSMVIRQGLLLVSSGLAFGVVGAFLLLRTLSSLLYAVKPTDPLIMFGACVVLLAVTILATYRPARRASRLDPVTALRYE